MNQFEDDRIIPRWYSWAILICGAGFIVFGIIAGHEVLEAVAIPGGVMIGIGISTIK